MANTLQITINEDGDIQSIKFNGVEEIYTNENKQKMTPGNSIPVTGNIKVHKPFVFIVTGNEAGNAQDCFWVHEANCTMTKYCI